ncbi:hypothetical protein LTT02_22530 [Mycolicibacterium smegmatis]|uniref:hypothetical protein n=1 Tax=Mycolicibacterium smegmatis TaxID=1772 RepID=UPI0005D763AB|nr:hypothetical protein [Mycolicibacterium smegmatis]MDF1901254.1 hypothetical protein [Mycolicibacterium smegmatis]MDF1907433.1 hypothetical protein [Mycolicibacterium smegmatis]MDF1920300.1 hypothetical protein [Mycolicibacterium smegmatis]MDF1925788.1 hypothetical protein [Mycolicibacterium smegmatis]UAK58791.1 hypothetical protein K8P01_13260 [Mycolicibacterium smegmatis]
MGSKKNVRSGSCRHRAPVIALAEYRRCARREPRDVDDVIEAPVTAVVDEPPDGAADDDEGGIILCW